MARKVQPKIRQYILRLIGEGNKNVVSKTIETFNISRSTVYNYISDLKNEGLIEKKDGAYSLKNTLTTFRYTRNNGLFPGEDSIFEKDIKPLLHSLPDNIFRAWRYAFTEMMNNAIEHSEAESIVCGIIRNDMNTTVIITDDGIGIFKNIQRFMRRESGAELTLSDCASILLAGKFTTAADRHSGEGIFFTSHLCDYFVILSDGIVFTRTDFNDENIDGIKTGNTTVYMRMSNRSTKTVSKIFDRFSTIDDGFFRTHIPIAHMFPDYPVSRSEARRLGEMLTRFKEVILDFSDIDEIGQAFAHELFVVWQKNNPNVTLKSINANKKVTAMSERVKNTK